MWHVDQYDKLRHYGFCIHGAIDGFSRRVMWLEVFSTNRDPWIVARYYFKAISMVKGKLSKIELSVPNLDIHNRVLVFRVMSNGSILIPICPIDRKFFKFSTNLWQNFVWLCVVLVLCYSNTNLNGQWGSTEIEPILYFNFSCTRKSKTWSWNWEYSYSRMSSFFKAKPSRRTFWYSKHHLWKVQT